jgi:hypothetical protein
MPAIWTTSSMLVARCFDATGLQGGDAMRRYPDGMVEPTVDTESRNV